MRSHPSKLSRAIVLGAATMLAGTAAGGTGTDDLCGGLVTENLTLDHDVVCPGNGPRIGADGLTIDLNGHALNGSAVATSVGIVIDGRHDVVIAGGTIGQFGTAVRVSNSTGLEFKHLEFSGHREGIDFQAGSADSTVKDCVFRDSSVRAVMLRGDVSRIDIKDNRFAGNRVGVLLFASTDSTVKANEISGSVVAGIRVNALATGNVVKDNVVSTSLAGIEFLVASGSWAQGNELKSNTLVENTCGLKGPTSGNTFKETSFAGNTADTCS